MSALNLALLFGSLAAILVAVGFAVGGFTGMVYAFVLALIINLVSYLYSDRLVLRMYRAEPYENPRLAKIVDRLAHAYRLPKPRLFLVKSRVPNAFATGKDPKHAAVAVTEGILSLTDGELEGVLAHELGHVKNRDLLVGTMAATIAGAVSILAQIGYYSMFARSDRDRGGAGLIGLVLVVIFAPLAALLVRMAISRRREYGADYSGAVVTKQPKQLASALRKISVMVQDAPMKGNAGTGHLWIVNPFKADAIASLFSTHPPIEQRIERLEEMEAEE